MILQSRVDGRVMWEGGDVDSFTCSSTAVCRYQARMMCRDGHRIAFSKTENRIGGVILENAKSG